MFLFEYIDADIVAKSSKDQMLQERGIGHAKDN